MRDVVDVQIGGAHLGLGRLLHRFDGTARAGSRSTSVNARALRLSACAFACGRGSTEQMLAKVLRPSQPPLRHTWRHALASYLAACLHAHSPAWTG
jgi:hypothetical protein